MDELKDLVKAKEAAELRQRLRQSKRFQQHEILSLERWRRRRNRLFRSTVFESMFNRLPPDIYKRVSYEP